MARTASRYPTELELEILKILWRDGPCTVRHVREELAGFRELAHTSVITMMNIMVRKRYLAKKKTGKTYEYRPVAGREDVAQMMLGDLVDRVFDGSATSAALHLLETADLDEAELERLKGILAREREE